MTKKISSILIILLLTSCYSYGYGDYETKSDYSKSVTYKKTNHAFFWGLKKAKPSSETQKKCEKNKGKITKIESDNGVFTYIVRIYTLGIYWPQKQEIQCEKLS